RLSIAPVDVPLQATVRTVEARAAVRELERVCLPGEEVSADHRAWRALGSAYMACGRLNEAVWAFRRAVNLAPRSATFHFDLARALERAGNLRSAAEAMATAVALDPGHDAAWEGL